jgi:predicted Zn finger-like uncharacterized protein
LIVACPACAARYRYDEARFEGKPSKKIRCTKCEAIFEIANPAAPPSAAPLRAPAADVRAAAPPINPPPLVGTETTFTRRPEAFDYRPRKGETTREHAVSRSKSAPHSATLRLPAGKKLSLAVISGPDAGKTFPIDKPRVVIGRSGAEVALSDAEISRSHAAIEVDDDDVTVFDLGSTNGTYFAGERVESAKLDHYGEFEVGGTTLMLIVTENG